RRTILALNLTTGRDGCGGDEIIQNLTLTGSWTLLNVWKNYVIAIQGFPNKFYQLNLGVITGLNNEKGLKINWTVIDQPNVVEDVIPHGGPHSVSVIEIKLYIQTLVYLGYSLIEDYVESLIGKIGHLEIEEVQTTVKYFVEKNYADPNAIALIGGSHGGFISGHLVGKFPDFYKACILNNPVLNIG
ncbi:12874_t:CDS:2, partial [Dentiscutata erythropus]